jgi:hypothetical protein
VILWNVDSRDWESKSFPTFKANIEVGIQRIDGRASGLVLFHDTVPDTAAHIEEIVNIWQSSGYSFVSLDECLSGSATETPVSSTGEKSEKNPQQNNSPSFNIHAIFASMAISLLITTFAL